MLEADPPLHTRTRGVLSKVLARGALDRFRDRFTARAEGMVREVLERGAIDAVRDLAEAYPLSVFPDAIGLREEGRENLLPYGNMAFNAFGPRNELFEESFANAQRVVGWIQAQCRRDALHPDGIGAQVYRAADEEAVSEEEAGLLVRSLLTAGLDTTIFGLGAALYCFARFPDQWQALRANPQKARGAFEEVIRYISPVQTFFRTTTVPVTSLNAIPADQKVLLFLAAANRDPRKWDEPDRFDIGRKTLGHVGFGYGIHACVGQMVARLEAEILLTVLARRVGSIELAGEPGWRLNNTLHGLDRLPVELHPRGPSSRARRRVLQELAQPGHSRVIVEHAMPLNRLDEHRQLDRRLDQPDRQDLQHSTRPAVAGSSRSGACARHAWERR